MSQVLDTLMEMGFPKHRAEIAIEKTSGTNVEEAMEWLLTHEEELEVAPSLPEPPTEGSVESKEAESSTNAAEEMDTDTLSSPSKELVAKSIKCEECGKLFKNNTEVEFHAAKSGHGNFSESTEEKKPLTEEEKKEQLAKIEAKLKQRRLEREAKEKLEELEREKNRIKSGKEMLEAKKKHEDLEIKKMVEQRKREKEEEKLARQRVKDQIEQDKLMRKAKFGGVQPAPAVAPVPTAVAVPTSTVDSASKNCTEVRLQIRLTNGSTLTHTFGAKEPLSVVKLFIEMNRSDTPGPFTLMRPFPRKVFDEEDFEKPLYLLDLAPSAVLTVAKPT